jgi:hypothetical protein
MATESEPRLDITKIDGERFVRLQETVLKIKGSGAVILFAFMCNFSICLFSSLVKLSSKSNISMFLNIFSRITLTSAVGKAMQLLHDHRVVILSGREGTGKSKMCLEIASLCEEEDYMPYKVDGHAV